MEDAPIGAATRLSYSSRVIVSRAGLCIRQMFLAGIARRLTVSILTNSSESGDFWLMTTSTVWGPDGNARKAATNGSRPKKANPVSFLAKARIRSSSYRRELFTVTML